ncbi:MBL fold metallo-hydrolase [Poritiphilus flavus]|uniref:Metallo-beta-lactamase domain-containing protein n=1 Tax=Poritiphilus flavus TaxID=2697053 RepID=A0A6L9EHS8_9FLAO|nr:MBL fold metallo-hydrolase [Poritiphilus flavus]NAS14337.1 hypothetical protein [Poritiphilus flavus]
MVVRVFQSDKGDCMLYQGKDDKMILIDGGMAKSYNKYVSKFLEGKTLDLLCVSHIDQDHIQGILEMMKHILKWRVYDYQRTQNNRRFKKPNLPKPPNVLSVWHNAFNDSVLENDGRIEDMLAAASAIHSLSDMSNSNLFQSKREAILLSNRLKPSQLHIPLNKEFNGKLVYYNRSSAKQAIGGSNITIIGPFKEDLDKLRNEWNKWLRESRSAIARLRRKAEEDSDLLGNADTIEVVSLSELGIRSKVSTPNLASIMFLIEEDGKTALFTGDGHAKDILKGLKANGKLDKNGLLHLNLLKVQHHGSEHNIDLSFCKSITADNYVFCGNGSHENPDLEVVKIIIDSRIGIAKNRSANEEVSNEFKLWFNSSENNTYGHESKHMKKLKDYVEKRAKSSNGKMSFFFIPKGRSSFQIKI